MRVLIMGAGGIGGYYGAKLAQAGHEVTFVARGPHLAAMRSDGLRLTGVQGDLHLPRVTAVADPAEAGPADIALFCVKLYDTETAAEALRPALLPGTRVLSLQNGVDAIERIDAVLGAGRTLGGAAYLAANIEVPGVIRTTNQLSRLVFGAPGETPPEARALHAALVGAGVEAELTADIRRVLWEKFAVLATNSALTALTRLPVGHVYPDPDLRALAEASIGEVIAVGRAEGVGLDDGLSARTLALFDSFPPGMVASQLTDLRKGRRLELPSISGHIVALGRRHAVPTPFHAFAWAVLKPWKDGPPTDVDAPGA